MGNFSKLVFDKYLKVEDLDFSYLYGLTRNYGNLFGVIIGNYDKKPNSATISIETGYVFVTIKTKKVFLSIKIENDNPSFFQLQKLKNLFNLVWNEKGTKEDKALLKRIKTLNVDEIVISKNAEIICTKPEPQNPKEDELLKELWGNETLNVPTQEIHILPNMTHKVVLTEQNENN